MEKTRENNILFDFLPFLPAFNLYVVTIHTQHSGDKRQTKMLTRFYSPNYQKKNTQTQSELYVCIHVFYVYVNGKMVLMHLYMPVTELRSYSYSHYIGPYITAQIYNINVSQQRTREDFSLAKLRLRLWSYFVQSHSYFIILSFDFL